MTLPPLATSSDLIKVAVRISQNHMLLYLVHFSDSQRIKTIIV